MTEFERGRAAGLAEAVEVLNAYREYDKPMCCDGRECGCQGASVFDTIEHYIRALAASPSDHVLVPRHLLIEALVIGEAAVNDDYRRPCGQIPFDAAHKFKMAAFRKIRAMIAQGEGYGRE